MPVRKGRYLLEQLIGHGGMAEVWAAVRDGADPAFPLVVKVLRDKLAAEPDQRAYFVEEARLGLLLRHPNIVAVLELDTTAGAPFFSMERIDGLTVSGLIERSNATPRVLPSDLCVYLVARAAEGLHHAHELLDSDGGRPLHLVHRDVSPANILLSRRGDVKVADFGIAKVDSSNRPKTRVGFTKGKLAYMSPEQARGEALDRRTDVYALGVVLWELLTGDLLLHDPETRKSLRMRPPAPSRLRDGVDDALDPIVLSALALEPKDRPPTAQHLEEALDAWLHKRGVVDARKRLGELVRELAGGVTEVGRNGGSVAGTAPHRLPRSDATDEETAPLRARTSVPPFDLSRPGHSTEGIPEESVAIGTVVAAGPRAVVLPSARPEATTRTVPTSGPPLIGRETEMTEIGRHVDDGARLVSLVGGAGLGKTRLGLAFADAWRARGAFPGGVVVADLNDAADHAAALAAIARALDVPLRDGGSPNELAQRIGRVLAAMGRCLLVLDGADALRTTRVDGPLTALVARAPRARVLATSRAPLGALHEEIVAVGPLPALDAIELFLERARAAQGRALPAAAHAVVADLARRLDGVPLALELAAALCTTHTPEQVLARVHAAAPEHVLSNVITTAVQLLDNTERRALMQASVFAGPFDLDAADSVLDVIEHGENAGVVLERLRSRSLITRRQHPDGARFALLGPVRDVAVGLLDDRERAAVEARHAGTFVDRARTLAARALAGQQGALSGLLEIVPDVVRACVGLLRGGASGAQRTLVLWGVASLEPLFAAQPVAPLVELLSAALAHRTDADGAAVMAALTARAEARRVLGQSDAALADAADAFELALRLDDAAAIARARLVAATVHLSRQRGAAAHSEVDLAITAARRAQHDGLLARALIARTKLHRAARAHDGALAAAHEAVGAATRAQDLIALGRAEVERAGVLSLLGRHADATRSAEAALTALEQAGDARALGPALLVRTVIEVDRETPAPDDAEGWATRAHALALRVGDARTEGMALGLRGVARQRGGALVDAREDYSSAAALLATADPPQAAYFRAALGATQALLGEVDAGARAISEAKRMKDAPLVLVQVFEAVVVDAALGGHAQRDRVLDAAKHEHDTEELRFAVRVASP